MFNKSEADELKQNEILLDEAFAIKNNYKIGDKMKVGSEQYLNDEYEFTVKGFIDSTNTTSMRTVGMVSKNMYIKMFGNGYKCILVSSDLPDDVMKEKLKNEIKDKGVEVVSYQEWIGSDKENTNQIMNIVYGILILGILLSMVGLINNGLVAYVQRKRSFAVLNSICMTKKQIYKMAIVENILSFIIAVVPGMIFGLIINIYMEKTTAGMDMFINTVFEIKGVLVLLGIILSLTVVETIVPIRKIKKMDLVKEIKYE